MPSSTPHALMVCTGNLCRSPMAEALARDYAARRSIPLEGRSASVMGLNGNPAHRNTVAGMKEVDLDLSTHRAQPVTDELVAWADYILVMEIGHASALRDRHPGSEDKIMMLGTFGRTLEIPDPIGFWKRPFRTSRELIRRCVEGFVDQLPPPRSVQNTP